MPNLGEGARQLAGSSPSPSVPSPSRHGMRKYSLR